MVGAEVTRTHALWVLPQYFPGAPFESLYTAIWQPGVEQVLTGGVMVNAPGIVLPRWGVFPFPLALLLEFPLPF